MQLHFYLCLETQLILVLFLLQLRVFQKQILILVLVMMSMYYQYKLQKYLPLLDFLQPLLVQILYQQENLLLNHQILRKQLLCQFLVQYIHYDRALILVE